VSDGAVGVSARAYHHAISDVLTRVVDADLSALDRAADLIARSLAGGGVIQAFGTGHSEALAMDFAGRAGGFVPTNRISLHDVVLFGDARPEILHNDKLERDPQIAHRLYELAALRVAGVRARILRRALPRRLTAARPTTTSPARARSSGPPAGRRRLGWARALARRALYTEPALRLLGHMLLVVAQRA